MWTACDPSSPLPSINMRSLLEILFLSSASISSLTTTLLFWEFLDVQFFLYVRRWQLYWNDLKPYSSPLLSWRNVRIIGVRCLPILTRFKFVWSWWKGLFILAVLHSISGGLAILAELSLTWEIRWLKNAIDFWPPIIQRTKASAWTFNRNYVTQMAVWH